MPRTWAWSTTELKDHSEAASSSRLLERRSSFQRLIFLDAAFAATAAAA